MNKVCTNCNKFEENKCTLIISEEIKYCIENNLYYFESKEESDE